MTFRIHALPVEPFRPLFLMDEAALATIGAVRMTATTPDSAPCRVSLIDAKPGESLILLNHRHLDAPTSPYRSKGPVFVREKAVEARPELGLDVEQASAIVEPTMRAEQLTAAQFAALWKLKS